MKYHEQGKVLNNIKYLLQGKYQKYKMSLLEESRKIWISLAGESINRYEISSIKKVLKNMNIINTVSLKKYEISWIREVLKSVKYL